MKFLQPSATSTPKDRGSVCSEECRQIEETASEAARVRQPSHGFLGLGDEGIT